MLAVGIGAVIAVFFWSTSVLRRHCAYKEALDSPGCWDGCVSEACGHFRGESFALRDGKAVVTAPAGRHWYLLSDYSRDFDSDGPAKLRQWLLETHPQWCVKDARRTYFILQARAMDADGCVGFGETANEDTLLLFWRDNDKPNGDWGCTYLGNRLYPLLDNANSVSINGEWLGIETSWRSTRNGGNPVIYQLEEINGEIGVGIYDYTSRSATPCNQAAMRTRNTKSYIRTILRCGAILLRITPFTISHCASVRSRPIASTRFPRWTQNPTNSTWGMR